MQLPGCPSRRQLSAYLLGTLPEGETERLIRHVESCPECETTVQTMENTADSLVARARQPVSIDPFAREPECRQAVAQASQIGREPPPAEEPSADMPEPGSLGQYQLLEKLGEGGMGTVYKARHAKLDRVVALKVLPKHRMADDRAVARFEREMRAVGRLDHPNIVRATDAGEVDGTPFLVMEYIDGWDLGELVRRLGQLPIAEGCELIRRSAVGLQAAHEHGLVHRDVKPSNLMLTRTGELKVLDLGLARFQADQPAGEEMTGSGQAMGTADYMAPEQASDSRTVDVRADIYSLGCTLYKLLCGQAPFSGPEHRSNFEKMMAHMQKPVPSIRGLRGDVPDGLAAVLEQMLAKDPDDRYAAPSDVSDALAPFCVGCDLPGLLIRAEEMAKSPSETLQPIGSTEEYPSSALAGTRPSHAPEAAAAPLPVRRRWKPLAIGAALAGIALLGVVLTLTTRHGTLIVEVDEEYSQDVQIEVKQGGELVEILNAKSDWAIRLRSGQYDVELKGGQDKFEIDRDSVTVKRGGRELVRVRLKRSAAAGDGSPGVKPVEPSTAVSLQVDPELRDIQLGEPLSGCALVSRPAGLPGVKSWTLETVGHRSIVQCVTYSPDGKWIGTAGHDGSIRLFSAATGELVRILVGHTGAVSALCWSPDGGVLASESKDATIRFWNPESGRLLRTVRPQSDGLEVMAWSPDGKTLAYNASGGQIGLWDVEANRPAEAFGYVEGWLAWSPDGKTLATWIGDRKIRLWDVESGTPGHTLGAPWNAYRFAWSPDGQILAASGSYAETVRLWDTNTGQVLRDLPAPGFSIPSVAFSTDGKILAAAATRNTNSGTILRWEVATFDPLPPVPTGHAWCPGSMAWSPDDRRIVVGDWTASVRIVDVVAQKSVRTHAGYTGYRWSGYPKRDVGLAWSPAGKELAVAIAGRLRVLSAVEGGSDARSTNAPQAAEVAWSADGSMLAFENTQSVSIVSADLYERLGGFKIQAVDESILAWSPQGKHVARGSLSGQQNVQLYDAGSKTVVELGEHEGGIPSMAWSPDGKLLATGGRDDKIRLFDAESGTLARELDGHPGAILNLAWSGDGSLLASASNNRTVRIWTVENGEFVTKKLNDVPGTLVFSPDQRYLACGTEATEGIGCLVWDLESGQTAHRLDCRSPKLLGFSSDGKQLTAIGTDGFLRRWDLGSGKLAVERGIHPSQSLLSEWSPDHTLVADFTCGIGIHLWRSESGDPIVAMALLGEDILHVSPSGHYRATPGLDVPNELVYVVQTDRGQEMLTPQEFAQRYGWKNDPQKVRLGQTGND